jgi:hypothetical protein
MKNGMNFDTNHAGVAEVREFLGLEAQTLTNTQHSQRRRMR